MTIPRSNSVRALRISYRRRSKRLVKNVPASKRIVLHVRDEFGSSRLGAHHQYLINHHLSNWPQLIPSLIANWHRSGLTVIPLLRQRPAVKGWTTLAAFIRECLKVLGTEIRHSEDIAKAT